MLRLKTCTCHEPWHILSIIAGDIGPPPHAAITISALCRLFSPQERSHNSHLDHDNALLQSLAICRAHDPDEQL